jgi:hypothetical protein
MPILVCSSVRLVGVVLPSPPSCLTSLKAAVYVSLVRAGGGGARNGSTEGSTKGINSLP